MFSENMVGKCPALSFPGLGTKSIGFGKDHVLVRLVPRFRG